MGLGWNNYRPRVIASGRFRFPPAGRRPARSWIPTALRCLSPPPASALRVRIPLPAACFACFWIDAVGSRSLRDRLETAKRRANRLGTLRHHPPRPLRLSSRNPPTPAPEDAPTISIVTPSLNQARFLE